MIMDNMDDNMAAVAIFLVYLKCEPSSPGIVVVRPNMQLNY